MTLFIHRNAGGRCPCGAENATCGPPSSVVPVDQLIEEVAAVSGPLKKYKVVRGGVETVMKLSDDDAKRLGVDTDDVVGGASTIEPVQPAEPATTDGGQGDDVGENVADSGPGDGEAQAAQEPSPGTGETPVGPQANAETTAAPAEPKKAPAKRRPASANKARTTAATKAQADGGS
ncbi:hypothetical protein [Streptomyces sp. NPDC051636]|uniref:hypothetical protein n=1 Tax=Streptomyces sp. NPDC051636 TaxID=3365663 RepID=UPI00379229CF